MNCPKCGNELPGENRTCEYCGWILNHKPAIPANLNDLDDKSHGDAIKRSGILIGILGSMVGLVLLGLSNANSWILGGYAWAVIVIAFVLIGYRIWIHGAAIEQAEITNAYLKKLLDKKDGEQDER